MFEISKNLTENDFGSHIPLFHVCNCLIISTKVFILKYFLFVLVLQIQYVFDTMFYFYATLPKREGIIMALHMSVDLGAVDLSVRG